MYDPPKKKKKNRDYEKRYHNDVTHKNKPIQNNGNVNCINTSDDYFGNYKQQMNNKQGDENAHDNDTNKKK